MGVKKMLAYPVYYLGLFIVMLCEILALPGMLLINAGERLAGGPYL